MPQESGYHAPPPAVTSDDPGDAVLPPELVEWMVRQLARVQDVAPKLTREVAADALNTGRVTVEANRTVQLVGRQEDRRAITIRVVSGIVSIAARREDDDTNGFRLTVGLSITLNTAAAIYVFNEAAEGGARAEVHYLAEYGPPTGAKEGG